MRVIVFLIVMAFSFMVMAEEPIQHYEMPAGTKIMSNGVEYKAFTLEEYRTIAMIYVGYNWLWEKKAHLSKRVELQADIESLYDLRLDNCNATVTTIKFDRDYQAARVDQFKAEAVAIRKEMKGQKVLFWTALLITGAAAAVSVVHDAVD